MHPRLSVACLVSLALLATTPVQAADPAGRFIELMLDGCLGAMERAEPVDATDLEKLPQKTAMAIERRSKGEVWSAPDAYITLAQSYLEDGVGCVVEWHGSAARRRGVVIDSANVTRHFDTYLTDQINSGRYIEVQVCDSSLHSYMRAFQTNFETERPFRGYLLQWDLVDQLHFKVQEQHQFRPVKDCEK